LIFGLFQLVGPPSLQHVWQRSGRFWLPHLWRFCGG